MLAECVSTTAMGSTKKVEKGESRTQCMKIKAGDQVNKKDILHWSCTAGKITLKKNRYTELQRSNFSHLYKGGGEGGGGDDI